MMMMMMMMETLICGLNNDDDNDGNIFAEHIIATLSDFKFLLISHA